MRGMRITEPLIVNLAPTGMVPTKETTPHVPLSAEEILDDVGRCRELGVSIVHVHARDEHGAPTHRAECFAFGCSSCSSAATRPRTVCLTTSVLNSAPGRPRKPE
jgi:uncharacterized protein (DUF849 family)